MTQPTRWYCWSNDGRYKNKKLVAYHEVGHAIVGSVLENHDEVEK
jgi:ATP-dependent Zn protease